LGFSSFGDLTFASAAYCSRYIMDKVTGGEADLHYEYMDFATGEILRREPEFAHMSLKPGIGSEWIDRYMTDVYPDGFVVVNGKLVRPPKYYDKRFSSISDDAFVAMCERREYEAYLRRDDNTNARLAVKEQVLEARVRLLKRGL
jgi:hypothetical protein